MAESGLFSTPPDVPAAQPDVEDPYATPPEPCGVSFNLTESDAQGPETPPVVVLSSPSIPYRLWCK